MLYIHLNVAIRKYIVHQWPQYDTCMTHVRAYMVTKFKPACTPILWTLFQSKMAVYRQVIYNAAAYWGRKQQSFVFIHYYIYLLRNSFNSDLFFKYCWWFNIKKHNQCQNNSRHFKNILISTCYKIRNDVWSYISYTDDKRKKRLTKNSKCMVRNYICT